jgi:DNA-binding NtrC family response regulator
MQPIPMPAHNPHDPAFASTMMAPPGAHPTSPMQAIRPQSEQPPPGHIGGGTVVMGGSLPSEMEALERQRILDALARCGGNQTQAAEMLGISRRTLLRRLDEYAVPRPRK